MQQIERLSEEWFRHRILLHHAGALRLGVLHANFGTVNQFNGNNCIPENRIFFAIDRCGHTEVEHANGKLQRFELSAGSTTFVPACSPLHFHFTPGRLVGIHFYLEVFPGLDLLMHEAPQQMCNASNPTPLAIYQQLISEFSVRTMMQISGLMMLAASPFATTSLETLSQQVILRERYADLARILDTKLDAQLTIADLAGEMRLTRDQLSKRFRKDLGEPLKKYLSKMLVRRSCELLSKGNNIKSTAKLLHFSDEFYFSRFFKKHTGSTPSDYIKSQHR